MSHIILRPSVLQDGRAEHQLKDLIFVTGDVLIFDEIEDASKAAAEHPTLKKEANGPFF